MSADKHNVNSKVLKSGVWYLFSNFVVKGMVLITTPIFTRLMTKEEFGEYSNYTSWLEIVFIVVTMKMESSLISAKFDYEGRLSQYNFSALGLTLLSTAVWAFVINIFSEFFSGWMGLRIAYINMMLIYCFFCAIINFYQITERYLYRYKRSVAIAILSAISVTIVSILLVLNMSDKVMARVIGSVAPIIVIGIFLLRNFIKEGRNIDFSVWPYALKICVPYIPHVLSLFMLNSLDRIMITRICGPSDTALYSVAYTCGHMLTLFLSAMNGTFSPWLGDKLHEADYGTIRKVTNYYVLTFCVISLPLILLAPEVLLILGGESYLEAKYVMIPVFLGGICQFLYTLYVNVEQYLKRTVGMAIASVITAGLNYLLNLWLIPIFGYVAAGYTTFVSYLFLLIVHMLLVKRMRMSHCYNNLFNMVVISLIVMLGVGVGFLYNNDSYRYTVITIMLLVVTYTVIKNKEKLMVVIKTVKK